MEQKLLDAIQILSLSAMGIEKHLSTIAANLDIIEDRLDGIEDSFRGFTPTGEQLVKVNHSIDGIKTELENITHAIDRKP